MHKIVSQQKVGASVPINQKFIRSVRNFMNNWEVHGGTFKFDGYKAVLRIGQGEGIGGFRAHPFRIRRNTGLFVELDGGMVFSSNRDDSINVGLPEFELADDATSVIYLQVSIEFALTPSAGPSGENLSYRVASATIGHGASLPADTWVDGGAGDGYKYVEIGTVAATGGVLAKPAQKLYNDYFEMASAIRYFIAEPPP
jgi:hypothetical protein